MMIGEDLPLVGDKKSGAENIEVYFRTGAGHTQERVIMLVCYRFACACYSRIVQLQSCCAITKANDNVNEAHARLIGLDNRLRDFAFSINSLQAPLYLAQLALKCRDVFGLAVRNLRSQVLALLLKLKLLGIASRHGIALHIFHSLMRTVHQLLLRQDSSL